MRRTSLKRLSLVRVSMQSATVLRCRKPVQRNRYGEIPDLDCPQKDNMKNISIALTVLFIVIALPPIFGAFGFTFAIRDLVAAVNGEPVFAPGPIGTFIVAIALFCFAGVSLALGYSSNVPVRYLPFLKDRVKEELLEAMGWESWKNLKKSCRSCGTRI